MHRYPVEFIRNKDDVPIKANFKCSIIGGSEWAKATTDSYGNCVVAPVIPSIPTTVCDCGVELMKYTVFDPKKASLFLDLAHTENQIVEAHLGWGIVRT